MAHYDEQFQPEMVDEQLQHLSLQPAATHNGTSRKWDNAANRRFIEHLRRSYHENAAEDTEDARSLARTWKHIAQHSHLPEETLMPALQQQHDIQEFLPIPAKKQTITQRIGLLVAILFLTALVGSLLVVLNMTHRAGLSSNHVTAKTTATHVVPHQNPQLYLYAVSDSAVYKMDNRNGHILWSNPLGNLAAEPIVVANDIIYAVHQSYQQNNQQNATLYALSTSNGKVLWQYKDNNGNYLLPLAAANSITYMSVTTPSTSYLCALNATNGKLLWQYTVGYAADRIVVADGIVYGSGVTGSREINSVVYALDATTGAQRWRIQGGAENIYIAQVVNGVAYGYSARDNKGVNPPVRYSYIYAFNAQSGAQIWHSEIIHQYLSAAPIVTNGVIYFGTDELGTAGPLVYALDATNGTVIWTKNVGGPISSSPLVLNGVVYVGTHTDSSQTPSPVVALNATNGSVRWSHQLMNYFDFIATQIYITPGLLYIATTDNIVHILSIATGHEIHSFTLPAPTRHLFFGDLITLAP